MSYTARLENWAHDKKQNIIVGDIYFDIHGRWPDGTFIRTSRLKPMSMQIASPKEGVVIATENSQYMLGKKK